MSTHDVRDLSPEDRALVDRIRAATEPSDLMPNRRAQMRRAIEERSVRDAGSWWPAAVAAACAGALALVAVLGPFDEDRPQIARETPPTDRPSLDATWAESVLLPIDETDPTAFDEEDAWPDTYLALASYLDA